MCKVQAAIKISTSYYLCLLSFKTRWHLPDSARQSSQSKWLQRCTPIKGAPAQIPCKQTSLLIVFKSTVCTLVGIFSFLITHRRKQPAVIVFFLLLLLLLTSDDWHITGLLCMFLPLPCTLLMSLCGIYMFEKNQKLKKKKKLHRVLIILLQCNVVKIYILWVQI